MFRRMQSGRRKKSAKLIYEIRICAIVFPMDEFGRLAGAEEAEEIDMSVEAFGTEKGQIFLFKSVVNY